MLFGFRFYGLEDRWVSGTKPYKIGMVVSRQPIFTPNHKSNTMKNTLQK
jgi:hypothetical protein